MISIVFPVYNEEGNLELLHEQMIELAKELDDELELVFADDRSTDRSPEILAELRKKDPRVKFLRFSRNCGSHAAITAGLRYCTGECAIVMASDLQDPPSLIPRLLEERKNGAMVVFASRNKREGEPRSVLFFSRIYWWAMNTFTDLTFAKKGTDVVLMDRLVIEAFLRAPEKHGSIFMLIQWLGFPQTSIEYIKEARHAGVSGWTYPKKVKLFLDSLFSFSSIPIRVMTLLGGFTVFVGFLLSIDALVQGLSGRAVEGWASLALIVLGLGGLQMIMLGILGEYIWRTFDETRNRPFYVIESAQGLNVDPRQDAEVRLAQLRAAHRIPPAPYQERALPSGEETAALPSSVDAPSAPKEPAPASVSAPTSAPQGEAQPES